MSKANAPNPDASGPKAAGKRGSLNPEDYKKTPIGRFTFNEDLEDIYKSQKQLVSEEKRPFAEEFVKQLLASTPMSGDALNKATSLIRRKNKFPCHFRKSELLHTLLAMQDEGRTGDDPGRVQNLRKLLVKKSGKSNSGVLVITVLTSPYPHGQKFSCEWNCYYCPNEPDQPRSYLHDEPSVLRANRNRFDPVLQFFDRAVTLSMNGHPVDKIELLILGGTWASYPVSYQEEFIRDLFFAANTFYTQGKGRERLSLDEEKAMNERAKCKIIGITLETRPDCINPEELRRFRRYGCTRVQLGVQHTDDEILKKINRGCTSADVRHALRLLKDSCYKVDIHLMPNLPGATPAIDRKMFNEVLDDPGFQADQWKIYPCETTPWTVIQKWYESGKYVPYSEEELFQVIMETKARVHPWIRLNRVIRDIPSQYILGGVDNPSMRQVLQIEMAKAGQRCRCIRCREVRNQTPDADSVKLVTRKYEGQGAQELFISFEVEETETILGFVRLRLPSSTTKFAAIPASPPSNEDDDIMVEDEEFVEEEEDIEVTEESLEVIEESRGRSLLTSVMRRRRTRSKTPTAALRKSAKRVPSSSHAEPEPSYRRPRTGTSTETGEEVLVPFAELKGAAFVRELHVYGQLIPTHGLDASNAQHIGLGTRLMAEAERVAQAHGYTKVAVISGVGVRDYYRKLGYELEGEGEFMIKHFPRSLWKQLTFFIVMTIVVFAMILQIIVSAQIVYKLFNDSMHK